MVFKQPLRWLSLGIFLGIYGGEWASATWRMIYLHVWFIDIFSVLAGPNEPHPSCKVDGVLYHDLKSVLVCLV
jgi:hypothetical protein